MEKAMIALLIFFLCFALAGCGAGSAENVRTESANSSVTEVQTMEKPKYVDVSYVKKISSPSGFGMEVASVLLTPEGEVILRTQGELAKSVGWQLTIAEDVKNIYVESFRKGEGCSIIMIKENGTVSAVNYAKVMQNKEIEVMDSLGGYQEVTGIEAAKDSDTKTVHAVINNGKKEALEPYLK